jgi:hypothetical protein
MVEYVSREEATHKMITYGCSHQSTQASSLPKVPSHTWPSIIKNRIDLLFDVGKAIRQMPN